MAKDYQIDETETELILHVPPPNTAWKVAIATTLLGFCIWYGCYCGFGYITATTFGYQGMFRLALTILALVSGVCLQMLFVKLTAKRVIFERHVVGVYTYLLGIRVRRRWLSVHRIQEWITRPNRDARSIRLALRYKDGDTVMLVETLDNDLWLSLIVRMQRKDFAFV